ncbi:MAG: putative zinc-binding peptidase [Ectothiorhodospiraceae bacterium]|nr:putative zinc-binding peptidase [Ectothiorhodospiraceae bacterium]
MKLFTCARCGNLLYFENVVCTRCGATLGFLPDRTELVAVEQNEQGGWSPVAGEGHYMQCANYVAHAVCNWMVPSGDTQALCVACRLNRTIPALGLDRNKVLWRRLEADKHRLVYALLRLGLPVLPKQEDDAGLAFDFLADEPTFNERGRVMTGHAQGLITLNIAEADPAMRERMRDQMAEPYRTILGHFRHESGHYYWDRRVRSTPWLGEVRALFGDDTQDYSQALDHHYREGPPRDWQQHFVSAYAACHPWEDWAESWAHYLHIVDTLETANQFGLSVRPRAGTDESLDVTHDFNAYDIDDFEMLIHHWLPLTYALNTLNRSMGHEDAYPFVLAPAVLEKLQLVHRIERRQ